MWDAKRQSIWLATGTQFDVDFRVIDAITSVPVLASGCYRFAVSQ